MKEKLNAFRFMLERNIRLYFKDRLTFFFSMMTPLILIVLFLLFLRGVYEDSIVGSLPEGFEISRSMLNSFTGSWLFSSILSTSCITIAFCSNMRIDDRLKKTLRGFEIAPIGKFALNLSYTVANFLTTVLICLIVLVISLIYLAIVGWYLTFADILLVVIHPDFSVSTTSSISACVISGGENGIFICPSLPVRRPRSAFFLLYHMHSSLTIFCDIFLQLPKRARPTVVFARFRTVSPLDFAIATFPK